MPRVCCVPTVTCLGWYPFGRLERQYPFNAAARRGKDDVRVYAALTYRVPSASVDILMYMFIYGAVAVVLV